jgi:hypothetical protein
MGSAEGEGAEGGAVSFTIINAEQRSAEWFAARLGRLTSSCADVLFKEGRKKGEESYQRRDLRLRLALERLTGKSQEDDAYQSDAMRRGVEREADARLAYEAATGCLVEHNEHMAGTSPDAVVDDCEGIVELKCPKSATHVGYLEAKCIPNEYLSQIRHHVWVSGAQWCDFVSWDDRLPEHLQLVIYRVTREQLDIPLYEKAVLAFLGEVNAKVESLKALRPVAA